MRAITILFAAGLCAAALAAAAAEKPDPATAAVAAPVRLVGENCPLIAPPGGRVERDIAAVDELAAAPRNVCLVFFEADPDDSKG